MVDRVWRAGHAPSGEIGEAHPNRAALTCTFAFIREGRLLLTDPHPEGSWDQWMLPYGSLILTEQDDGAASLSALSRSSSYDDVERTLEDLMDANRDRYVTSVRDALRGLGVEPHLDVTEHPLGVNYSIKYSSTSNSYTAYRFEYRELPAENVVVSDEALEIDLGDLARHPDRFDSVLGKSIASNVFDFARAWVN